MKAFDCDNCDFYDRDSICDECRKRNTPHREPVTDEEDTVVFTRISHWEEEE